VVSFGLLHLLPVNPRDAVANLQVLADQDMMPTQVALCVAPDLLSP